MIGRAGAGPLRHLIVLRHAKSAWPLDVVDHERPLAPRGRRDAPAAGRALADADLLPDLALCSTALRARRTWDLAAAEWARLRRSGTTGGCTPPDPPACWPWCTRCPRRWRRCC
ncbi:phosphohistidine phosphatase SixA [Streptomyces luteogriseus]|nr:phosphohistidine phosphatase SixA [Streptomyces luteogriseus]